jgi:flavin reductase (DIM6/NTAB) family NADH-FMN oxidoreductase RutF
VFNISTYITHTYQQSITQWLFLYFFGISATPTHRPKRFLLVSILSNTNFAMANLNDPKRAEAGLKAATRRVEFKNAEASRPAFDESITVQFTQPPEPDWVCGSGSNKTSAKASAGPTQHISIDPYAADRTLFDNYRLLVSGIVPRPIALVSTCFRDGKIENLAPFSFFQFVNVDPPVIALAVTSPISAAKDTLRNLLDTGECVINIVSEGFIEAVNASSANAPYGASEWDISGLTPVYDTKTVSPPRVKESIFSIEAKLESVRNFTSRLKPGTKSGSLQLVEATHFWAREDALTPDGNSLDISVSS